MKLAFYEFLLTEAGTAALIIGLGLTAAAVAVLW